MNNEFTKFASIEKDPQARELIMPIGENSPMQSMQDMEKTKSEPKVGIKDTVHSILNQSV